MTGLRASQRAPGVSAVLRRASYSIYRRLHAKPVCVYEESLSLCERYALRRDVCLSRRLVQSPVRINSLLSVLTRLLISHSSDFVGSHTVAPQTTAADAVISGSYTTVTTELTVTASSGTFGGVNATAATPASGSQSASGSSTVSFGAAASTQSTSSARRKTSLTTTSSAVFIGAPLNLLTVLSISLCMRSG